MGSYLLLVSFRRLFSFLGFRQKHSPMPALRFGSPKDVSAEPYLKWLHIPVAVEENREPNFSLATGSPLNCRVTLIFEEPPPRSTLPLLWNTEEGPKATIPLHPGEGPKEIPLLARSEKDCTLSAKRGSSPAIPLPAGVARITDQNTLSVGRPFNDLEPGRYKVRLRVQSQVKKWDSQTFRLTIPKRSDKNHELELAEETQENLCFQG